MDKDRKEQMQAFLEAAGWGDAAQYPLPGDASTRRYIRLEMNGARAMLMDQPQNAEAPQCPAGATPDERRALGYDAIARLAGADTGRFVAAANFLREHGLSAPEVFAADHSSGFVLSEDLGDALYADVLNDGGDAHELYGAAVDALAKLHQAGAPATLPPDMPLHPYDETALVAETDLLTEWFMPLALGRAASEDEVETHRMLWRPILHAALSAPPVFVHRDYHAQNLMWLPGREGLARVGMIDFQDAVAGAASYDLISLVEDARRDVEPELARAMSARYLDTSRRLGSVINEETYRSQMAVMAAQRNAKIAGIFARLYKRDGKPRYLAYLPRVWGYLNADLEHPALSTLKAWYDKTIPRERRGVPEGLSQ